MESSTLILGLAKQAVQAQAAGRIFNSPTLPAYIRIVGNHVNGRKTELHNFILANGGKTFITGHSYLIPPTFLPKLDRHPAMENWEVHGLYPNMNLAMNHALTMYLLGRMTAREAMEYIYQWRHPLMDHVPPNIPQGTTLPAVRIFLATPQDNVRLRVWITSRGGAPEPKVAGEQWFHAAIPINVIHDLYLHPSVRGIHVRIDMPKFLPPDTIIRTLEPTATSRQPSASPTLTPTPTSQQPYPTMLLPGSLAYGRTGKGQNPPARYAENGPASAP